MKKILILGLIIGIILGFLQIFFVRTSLTKNGYYLGDDNCDALVAECGYCPGLKEGNICYTDGVIQRYRGFPLSSKSGGNASSVSLGLSLYANMAIFIVTVPLLLLLIRTIFFRKKKNPKRFDTATTPPEDNSV